MSNTYSKYCPNVFLAKCEEKHEKGAVIPVTTKRGKENDSIVFNLIFERDGYYFYSIVRADGFNVQEWAKRKAERLQNAASNADKKSDQYYNASNKHRDFLSLGEPIKLGHHSEKRHRKIIEDAHNNMGKSIEYSDKADDYNSRAAYWESKADTINLSMPESIEFYQFEFQKATENHKKLKDNPGLRQHSYSLTYAKKKVNEMKKNFDLAQRLWGE